MQVGQMLRRAKKAFTAEEEFRSGVREILLRSGHIIFLRKYL